MPPINKAKQRPKSSIMDVLTESADYRVSADQNDFYERNAAAQEANRLLKLDSNEIEYIHRERIYPNPLNKPYIEEITDKEYDALKASIMDHGLFHNLVVIDDGKGSFRLISGEKRWTAINRMTNEEYHSKFPNGIVTKVLPTDPGLTSDDELIMLLTCNVLVFSNGTPDTKQIRDLIRLYKKKGFAKKELFEFLNFYLQKGNDAIYRFINEANAIDELYDIYSNKVPGKSMTRTAFQLLGGLPEEKQKSAIHVIEEEGINKIDEPIAAEIKRRIKDKKKPAGKAVGSVSFAKLDKLLKSAEEDIEKGQKVNIDSIEPTELYLAITKLDLMMSHIKELKEKLVDHQNTIDNPKK